MGIHPGGNPGVAVATVTPEPKKRFLATQRNETKATTKSLVTIATRNRKLACDYILQHPDALPAQGPSMPKPFAASTPLEPASESVSAAPAAVTSFSQSSACSSETMSMISLTFAVPSWQTALADFANTDVPFPLSRLSTSKLSNSFEVKYLRDIKCAKRPQL